MYYLKVWSVNPVVTHDTTWLESTRVRVVPQSHGGEEFVEKESLVSCCWKPMLRYCSCDFVIFGKFAGLCCCTCCPAPSMRTHDLVQHVASLLVVWCSLLHQLNV